MANRKTGMPMRVVGVLEDEAPGGPALVLQESDGSRSLRLAIPAREAALLASEFGQTAHRHSRLTHTYSLLEEVMRRLGGRVTAVRLVGAPRAGLEGQILVTRKRRTFQMSAHPGDAAVLASRMDVSIDVVAEIVGDLADGHEPGAGPLGASTRLLGGPAPQGFAQ